jgi:cytochrome b561
MTNPSPDHHVGISPRLLTPTLYAIHGTLGMTILVVMLIRLAWRLSNPVPRLPDTLRPIEKRLAHANHWLLYLFLIGMPIGGYLMVNARGYAVQFFDWKLPFVIGKNEALAPWIFYGHLAGALTIIALVVLHAAAALRHEFVLKDNVLRRMTPLPARPAPRTGRRVDV